MRRSYFKHARLQKMNVNFQYILAMRETTRLLLVHIPIKAIAELVESYIIYHGNAANANEQCSQTVLAGHWELSSEYFVPAHANAGLIAACEARHSELAHAMISAGANSFGFAVDAANHRCDVDYKLMDRLFLLGKTDIHTNFHLERAARLGNIESCKYFVSQGGDNFNKVLEGGCSSGRLDIIQLAISNDATDFSAGLKYAAIRGDRGICLLMLIFGADPTSGLYGACTSGNMSLAKYMVLRGARGILAGLMIACRCRNHEIVKYMISLGADQCMCGVSIANHPVTRETNWNRPR
jgi:hypothetical protein